MSKPLIKLRFQNGLTFQGFKKEVFDIDNLDSIFHFEESSNPDFIIFGPYGNDIPPKGDYVRIGYFCENINPDFSICEWAFGMPREEDIQRANYKKIQWHNLLPQNLIKEPEYNPENILASKTKFCNFLYSHKVPYREAFFKQLSKYKKVDAPGKSMNNMASIDTLYGGKWDVKKRFLSEYKFTIAFENDIFPGYQTEKLYDAMQVSSIPIYCGDPFIGDIFNTKSFVNVQDYIPPQKLNTSLAKLGQMDFEDIRPSYLKSPRQRIKRKTKSLIRDLNINLQFSKADFSPVIDHIIALDSQPELYLQYLKQPWFNDNAVPEKSSAGKRWVEIFS
ncbi:MAG TPA: glycosyltransferase family 10 [Mucilaginibacter sp.]|jgi:hypothetical protein